MSNDLVAERQKLHAILGTGPLARATAAALIARGYAVRFVSLSGRMSDRPAGTELLQADLLDIDASIGALSGAEVVHFCAQPPYHQWVDKFDALQSAAIAAAKRLGSRLIVAENLYGYGPSRVPLREDLPLRPTSRKGEVRARMHLALLAEHRSGNLRVAVARASDFYGPGVLGSVVGERFMKAVLAGKSVEVMGNPDVPHAYTYIEDFGAAMAVLGTSDEALGDVWHVPSAPAVSTRRFAELAFKVAGFGPARLRRMSRVEMRVIGIFVPPVRESIEMLYEFEEAFLVDHTKFAARFGDIATPIEAALSRTFASMKTQD